MELSNGMIVIHKDSGARGVILEVYKNDVSVSVLNDAVNSQGSTILAGDKALWLISNLKA